jgi:hypothetical protein
MDGDESGYTIIILKLGTRKFAASLQENCLVSTTAEPGYDDIGLCDTSSIVWYSVVPIRHC